MKIVQFEGTPEEFQAVSHLFSSAAPGEGEGKTVEPVDAIQEVLTRRAVSGSQKALFHSLAQGQVEYSKLMQMIERDESEMAGVLGALGRRISNTPSVIMAGLPANVEAMLLYRQEGDQLFLSLQPHAREALERENLI